MGRAPICRSDTVSVVIPTHNRWNLIQRALFSLRKQTLPPTEILVIDDGSDEKVSPALLDSFPEVCWIRQKNMGVASARNLGIRKAKSQWIALLDSDDSWEADKLERQLTFLEHNPEILAVHTGERWIRNGNEVIAPSYLNKSADQLWERSLQNCLICPSSCLLHRSIFDTVGWFDESLEVCEDYDFWLRLLSMVPIGLVPEKLVRKYGGHSDQLSTTTWGMDRFRVQSLEKILSLLSLSEFQKKLILMTIVEKSSILAKGSFRRNKDEEAEKYLKKMKKYSRMLEITPLPFP